MEKDVKFLKCDYLSCVTVHETHFSDQFKKLSTIGGGRVAFCFLCNLITVWITYVLKNSECYVSQLGCQVVVKAFKWFLRKP